MEEKDKKNRLKQAVILVLAITALLEAMSKVLDSVEGIIKLLQ